MPVVDISELKSSFKPGSHMKSDYFMNLIDTLADDRAAVHVGLSAPEDPSAVPFWFNESDGVLKLFNGFDWTTLLETNTAYSLPKEDGLPGQVLITDGNGKVTWQTLNINLNI
jgi:hypothetical protein